MTTKKKLIEVALPLEAINKASAREKSIRHGHPSTLHLWWARRPLAAARAVIFAQMVDDPSVHPDQFPTEEAQEQERQRLFRLLEELVLWENTTNEDVLAQARDEIWKSWRATCSANKDHPRAAELFNPDKLPAFHDPFAGGGSLPLEAQRLGLESYASDLNPVAVLINKAMIEIPPRFAGQPPVNPEARADKTLIAKMWRGTQGLAEDVRYYGQWMRDEAEKRIGHLYPKIEVTTEMAQERPDLKPLVGHQLTVIAWLWARTVKSPNPAFAQVDVPLASTFMLSTKAGKEAYVEPVIEGSSYRFTVKAGKPKDTEAAKNGTKLARGANFRCVMSGTPISPDYIYAEANAGHMGAQLMAIVAEGERGRVYLSSTPEHEAIACEAHLTWKPEVAMPENPRWFSPPLYGLKAYGDLFTPRQLVALTTFSDLVQEAREKVMADYLGARASRPPLGCEDAGETPALPGWHSRGYLPHWEAGETSQSITFRLHDSLPRTLREHWRAELANLGEAEQQLERRKRIEAALDAGHGACFLQQPEIAALVENALLHFDEERYRLHAWVVMPNHVHVLVTPSHGNSLSSLVHAWKSFTAKAANRLLGREGAFWFEEYFDRAIRDDRHFVRAVEYIENNPVQAGLCAQAADWLFGSARLGASLGARPSWALPERAGRPRSQDDDVPLDAGGTGAQAYADAVAVYLACGISRLANRLATICVWNKIGEKIEQVFARQAIPMTWDFPEANAFSDSTGGWSGSLGWIPTALEALPLIGTGRAEQANASEQSTSLDKLVSTDPPYYDNIGYADLSDFFYVWQRRALRSVFADLFATLAVPKAEELVATPYRHGSKEKAEEFFLAGMTQAMHRLAEQTHPAFPITIYYAFKQSENLGARASSPPEAMAGKMPALPGVSTGWETFLEAVIRAGFTISGTWPIRTERDFGVKSGTNVLASSIVLVCRKRAADAPPATRREFLNALNVELPDALMHLQRSNIAPVDLAQAAIGPGMAVYTRYARVLDTEGKPLSVREALALINQTLDEILAKQEGDFDADSRWALAWFEQSGLAEGEYGVAETLSKAKNTSVSGMVEAGILASKGGKVRLLRPDELPADWDPITDQRLTVWEAVHQLIRVLEAGGESAAATLVAKLGSHAETARELAYRLYTLCVRKKRAQEALSYNGLVQSWPEITRLARASGKPRSEQGSLFAQE
jgi:putative DNA methylase